MILKMNKIAKIKIIAMLTRFRGNLDVILLVLKIFIDNCFLKVIKLPCAASPVSVGCRDSTW